MKDTITILNSYITTKYLRNFTTRQHVITWQNKQVHQFLHYILSRSPFYHNLETDVLAYFAK